MAQFVVFEQGLVVGNEKGGNCVSSQQTFEKILIIDLKNYYMIRTKLNTMKLECS